LSDFHINDITQKSYISFGQLALAEMTSRWVLIVPTVLEKSVILFCKCFCWHITHSGDGVTISGM